MTTRDRALKYTRRALDRFDQQGITVNSLLRFCLRVASLREDALGLAVLQMETEDLQVPKAGRTLFPERVQTLSAVLPYEEAHAKLEQAAEAKIARRSIRVDQIWGGSIAGLEHSVSDIERKIKALESSPREGNEEIRLMLEETRLARIYILERTKSFLFDYLLTAETELERGQSYANVFEQTMRYVQDSLMDMSPEAAEEFRASEQRLFEATPAALSQALVSCRRVLKTLADSVYPAREDAMEGIDGTKRRLGDDQYVNRLLQYAMDRTNSKTTSDVFQHGLDALGRRLTAVNALASKGVHGSITVDEARACFTQTYLLTAEILRLRDETSVRLHDLETNE